MNLLVLSLTLILGSFESAAVCAGCAYEYGALEGARATYAQAVIDKQVAYLAYLFDPTPYNYGVWVAAGNHLDHAEDAVDNAEAAYTDCLLENSGGPIEDELLSTTVSILE